MAIKQRVWNDVTLLYATRRARPALLLWRPINGPAREIWRLRKLACHTLGGPMTLKQFSWVIGWCLVQFGQEAVIPASDYKKNLAAHACICRLPDGFINCWRTTRRRQPAQHSPMTAPCLQQSYHVRTSCSKWINPGLSPAHPWLAYPAETRISTIQTARAKFHGKSQQIRLQCDF